MMGINMAELRKNRQIEPATIFTCNIIFTKIFVNSPNFTCHIAKFYLIFFPDCVFVCSFKVK